MCEEDWWYCWNRAAHEEPVQGVHTVSVSMETWLLCALCQTILSNEGTPPPSQKYFKTQKTEALLPGLYGEAKVERLVFACLYFNTPLAVRQVKYPNILNKQIRERDDTLSYVLFGLETRMLRCDRLVQSRLTWKIRTMVLPDISVAACLTYIHAVFIFFVLFCVGVDW